MGVFVTNYAEVGRIKCEFSVAVHKKKGKVAEGWVLAADDKKTVLQGAGTQTIRTCVERRQAEVAEWVALRNIFYICLMREGGDSRRHGGGRRHQRSI